MAQQAIETLWLRGDLPALTTQNLIEFWAVATRPAEANGLGWTPAETKARLDALTGQFHFLEDTPDVRGQWLALVFVCEIRGKKTHDARLVAVMKVHGVTHLLTFNRDDFKLFSGITLMEPHELVATPP